MRLFQFASLLPALSLLVAGCNDPLVVPDDGAPASIDAAVEASDLSAVADLSRPPDLASAGDLRAPSDLATPVDGGVIFCSLPDQPVACVTDAECAPFGGRCDANRKSCVCLVQSCTPGADQSCNEDPRLAALHGHCTAFGACQCRPMYPKSPTTGKCL